MKFKKIWDLLTGKTQAKNPAKVTIKNVWAVVQSAIRSVLPQPRHISEQILWRRLIVMDKSPECWEKGSCIQCGCDIIDKTKSDIGCENEPYCYPPMMTKQQWKEYKFIYDLKIFD